MAGTVLGAGRGAVKDATLCLEAKDLHRPAGRAATAERRRCSLVGERQENRGECRQQ